MGWTDEEERSISGAATLRILPWPFLPFLPFLPVRPKRKCRRTDSNRRPRAYETRALNQLSYSGQNYRLYSIAASRSMRAAASSGIMISWWPTRE